MKIQNIKSTDVKFGQNNTVYEVKTSNPQQPQIELPKITTIPSQFVKVNAPVSYSKIGELEIFEGKKTHIYKLSNGQTIVMTPTKGETQINTTICCGSSNEPDNLRGISHYIEHNLFNGSKNLPAGDFEKKADEIGAYTNAATSYDYTNYYIKSNINNDKDLKKMVEIHADMLQNPTFDQKMLDKEKGIVNSEISMVNDKDFLISENTALKQLFQIKSTSSDIVIGTIDNINSLTRDDVVSYYNTHYTPDKMVTVLTGEFEPEKMIDLIAKNFTKPLNPSKGNERHLELNPIEKSVRSDLYVSNTDAAKFSLMLKGPQNKNLKENICVDLILNMLNLDYSPIKENLKKYNCDIAFSSERLDNTPETPKYISIFGDCKDKDTEEVLKTIYSNIFNFNNNNLAEDLEAVKKQYTKAYLVISEDGNNINKYLSHQLQDCTPEEIKNIPSIAKSITVDDIKNTFNKYFDLNKVSIAVAHPKVKEKAISFKGNLENKCMNLQEFKYTKLPNNTDIYLKDDNSDLKSFMMVMKTPQPANINPMLCRVLNCMLEKGSMLENESNYNKFLEKNGITLDINTTPDGIVVSSNALKEDLNLALNKTVEVLNYPKLTMEEFEKARNRIAQDLDNTEKSSNDYINEVMFPQMKSASTVENKKEALKNLQLGDIIGFLQYVRQNAQNKFVWNKSEIPYELNKLGTFQPNNYQEFLSYKPLENDVLKTQINDKQQASILQTYKFHYQNTPEEIANIRVLNSILGGMRSSRLFNDLREKQKLAYHTASYVEKIGNTGILSLEIETTTDNPNDKNATSTNIQKSLDGFKKHVEDLKNEKVTDEELSTAKKICKSGIKNNMLTNFDKMSKVLIDINNGDIDLSNKVIAAIDKVTPESLQKTAQRIFSGYSMISIVASEKTLKESGFVK